MNKSDSDNYRIPFSDHRKLKHLGTETKKPKKTIGTIHMSIRGNAKKCPIQNARRKNSRFKMPGRKNDRVKKCPVEKMPG